MAMACLRQAGGRWLVDGRRVAPGAKAPSDQPETFPWLDSISVTYPSACRTAGGWIRRPGCEAKFWRGEMGRHTNGARVCMYYSMPVCKWSIVCTRPNFPDGLRLARGHEEAMRPQK